MSGLELFFDLLFAVDILLCFNTGIYKNGILFMNRKEIILDYLKTWFLLDLLATFPYS
jgi:hypothetical protein